MPTFDNAQALKAARGADLGHGDWVTVSQDRIDIFADATDDHQWIHVDPERAGEGPFGGTIAHGYLTLALLPQLCKGMVHLESRRLGVNYGLNRVRFPAPVPAGSRVRARATLAEVDDIEGGVQVVLDVTVEREGDPKPVCVAQTVTRYYL
jgi:acyl dehydratase